MLPCYCASLISLPVVLSVDSCTFFGDANRVEKFLIEWGGILSVIFPQLIKDCSDLASGRPILLHLFVNVLFAGQASDLR